MNGRPGGADRLACWLSWRMGAAGAGGEALNRTAWARRLTGPVGTVIAAKIGELLGDAVFVADVVGALDGVVALASVTRGFAAFHLWCSLDERPKQLPGLEVVVLGARLVGQGGLAYCRRRPS